VNCPSLLLPLPRDQRVRIPVSVRVRLFPATIRETSSRPNRHLCHRGSHNDDHGLEIRALTSHVPCVVKNRSETAARALPLPHLCSRSGSRNSSQRSGSEGRSLGVILGIEPCPKNVNQFTIDIIGYILSQMPATCRRGDERQAAISINAGLRERSLFGRSGQRSDCTDSLASDSNIWRFGDERWSF